MAGVPHGVAEPEDVPPQVAVLPDQVIASARALAQALGVLRLSSRRHRGAGGEVRVEQEAGDDITSVDNSAANRLIGEVVQSRRRPLLGPSPG